MPPTARTTTPVRHTLLAASFPMEGQVTLGAIMTLMVLIVALSFLWLRHHGAPREQMAV